MLPGWEDVVRRVWRLPVWARVIAALDRHGARLLPRLEVAPAPRPASPEDLPVDAFMARGRPAGLWAGAAAVDITPDPGCYLAGFGFERRASAVRDPLMARALVLTDGRTPLVLVGLDLIGLSWARTARLRALLSARFQDSVWLVSTHDHQAPDTLGLWGPGLWRALPYRTGLDPAYLARVEERVVRAVERALAAARPARLRAGQVEFDPEGRWVHNERSPLLDRGLRVLQLCGEDGATLATLAQHACHPETLWADSTLVSADFCGVCCRRLEAELGGVGLYLNGALGAMVSAAVGHATPADEREAMLVGLGEALGRAAVALARDGLAEIPAPALDVRRRPVWLPADENNLYRVLFALGVVERRPLDPGLRTEVSLARLGSVSLLGLPGEPAPALGLALLARLPGGPRLLLGLCNDELGYLLPEEFFGDPAYAYERMMTPGPSTARLLGEAVGALVSEGVA